MYISLFTLSIPANYTSEFRELFQDPTYGWSRNEQGRGSILGRARSPRLFLPRTEEHNCPLSAFIDVL